MCSQVCLGVVLSVILAVVQNGNALQCWTCNTVFDDTCKDYFNETKINENAGVVDNAVFQNRQVQVASTNTHVRLCENFNTNNYDFKNVCLKTVAKATSNGKPIVRRECRVVKKSLKEGGCPDDINSDDYEFCVTCEKDKCNGATTMQTNSFVAAVVSASFFLVLRH